jgi:hypothetical protein
MGLSATEVTPTIKLIIWFIFMSSRSLTPCLATIARPQDFTVSPMDCSAISPSGEKREPRCPHGKTSFIAFLCSFAIELCLRSRHERTFLNGQLSVKPCAKKSDDLAD